MSLLVRQLQVSDNRTTVILARGGHRQDRPGFRRYVLLLPGMSMAADMRTASKCRLVASTSGLAVGKPGSFCASSFSVCRVCEGCRSRTPVQVPADGTTCRIQPELEPLWIACRLIWHLHATFDAAAGPPTVIEIDIGFPWIYVYVYVYVYVYCDNMYMYMYM